MSKANEFVELVETLEEGAAWDATKRAAKSVGNFAKEASKVRNAFGLL